MAFRLGHLCKGLGSGQLLTLSTDLGLSRFTLVQISDQVRGHILPGFLSDWTCSGQNLLLVGINLNLGHQPFKETLVGKVLRANSDLPYLHLSLKN